MNILKQINLLIAFLLEIAMVVFFAYWGFHSGTYEPWNYIVAISLPSIVILLWGYFAAPKSKHRLKNPLRTVFKLSLFSIVVILAFNAGNIIFAICFGTVVILNFILLYFLSTEFL